MKLDHKSPSCSELLAAKTRLHVVNMTSRGGSSHVGSGLSIVDILAVLYSNFLNYDPLDPQLKDRDRFILSKGHAGAAVYAILSEVGFFPVSKLQDHYRNGSVMSGHVSHKGIPGVEFSTGSLGHGLSVGVGMAKAAKLKGSANKVVVVLSDGECDEGSNWEAIMFASHHKLDNLIAVVDYNKLQSLDTTENTLALEPLGDKFRSFGWDVAEIDGHDHREISMALNEASCRPKVLIAHTTKGKGVSFMENSVLWHYRSPKGDEYERAVAELKDALAVFDGGVLDA